MAQPTDKQFDSLLGISRKMEQSLENIEKSLSSSAGVGKNAGVSGAVSNLASMALSVNLIVKSLSAKTFKKTNADTVLNFVEGLAAATQKLKPANLEALGKFASGVSDFIESMSKISFMGMLKLRIMGNLLFSGSNPLLERILKGAVKAVEKVSAGDMKKLQEAGHAISLLADGLRTLTKAFAMLAIVALAAPFILIGAGIARLVVGMLVTIGKHGKEIAAGGKGMQELGRGLVYLAGGILVMALVAKIVNISSIIEIVSLVAVLSLVFFIVGKGEASIKSGAKAVKEMGMSLFALALGIGFLSLALMIIPNKILLAGMLVIAGYALIFVLIGKASRFIDEGALTMVLGMAVGLFFFAGGLLVFNAAVQLMTWEKAFLGIALIAAMGALFWGLGTFSKPIFQGAIALGSMGAALAVFSLGLIFYGLALKGVIAMFKNDWETAALATVGIILGLGTLFAGLGVAMELIAPGALALGLMGGALIVFSLGLIIYALALKGVIALFKNKWELAAEATVGIIVGLAGLFSLAGVAIIPIALGAAAIGLMGVTLIAFSVGLLMYSLAVKAAIKMGVYDEKTKEFKGISILKAIAKGIASLAWYIIPIAIGTPVALMLGASLVMISFGLMAAAKALKPINEMGVKTFTDALFSDDKGIIPAIAKGFKKVYKDFGGGGFLGALRTLTGTDPVSMGIRIVKGMGDVLSELAGGIAAFANFEKFPIKVPNAKGTALKWDTVNLFDLVPKIQQVLIGDGTDITKGLLYSLANVFGTIGKAFPEDGFFTDSSVKTGVKAVKGIGDVVSSIAGGIVAFANFEKFPIQLPDPADPSKQIYSLVNLYDQIPKIKNVLIGDGKFKDDGSNNGLLFTLANVFAEIGNGVGEDGFFGQDSAAKDGAQAVKQVADAIGGIATGILAFMEIDKLVPTKFDPKTGKPMEWGKISLAQVKANIIDLITTLPETFANLDTDMLDKAKDNAESYQDVSEIFASLGKSLKGVREAFLPRSEDKNEKGLLTLFGDEIKNFVSYLSANPVEDSIITSLNKLFDVFTKFSSISSPFKEFTRGFQDFDKTLKSFSGNISLFTKNFKGFVPQLKNYEKFAAVLNGQAYYGPRFAIFESSFQKMASDLKPFAENFKLMDTKTIEAFRFWTEALTNFVKIDPTTFQTVADQISKLKDVLPKEEKPVAPVAPEASTNPLFGAFAPVTTTKPQPPPTQESSKNSRSDENTQALIESINSLVLALSPLKALTVEGNALLIKQQ